MISILIIDDEEKLRGLLARIIQSEGFSVTQAADLKSGFRKLEQQHFDVVLCDVKLPDGSGVDFVRKVKSAFPTVEILLLTAFGTIPDGIQAMKNGAFDYIVKGDDNDRIIPLLYKAAESSRLREKVHYLQAQLGDRHSFDAIIGKSRAISGAIDLARKVSVTDSTVLLLGETGTGKEVFARAIHQNSKRSDRSFVALNCSAFGKDLLESELFGYKQGAFTGAVKDKKGFIEEADGGTLFLDEIGEMPLGLQAKLLRVLESGEFVRVGDTTPKKSNFRLIAATNRDLKTESENGHFRSDLYFRLNIFEVQIPPLRERLKDIPALVEFYVAHFSEKINRKNTIVSPDFVSVLQHYAWPGNIRELRNAIERSLILASDDGLTVDLLPFEIRNSEATTSRSVSAFSIAGAEKLQIQKVLNYTKGNKAEAARLLEIGIATLYRKIEEYRLEK
ncbi:sigma-54-dependent transcriptional regulator [Flavobacterium selenitireducens]|uniref:sigma-54-dependent transcriptional regulator n=1 Tax=Flavobacterium selenitireducens TaxID=2722704 RepID=UPI00168B1D20|nr:sigma-54 dependent transcriptional regulator [Flavobacterium selenitireducens]MBD3581208.1 sigma-54-dependent Fis family transcriptional regulator [Flavobacterium selenitireducens]